MNKINNRIKATLQQQNYDPSQPSETTATMRVCVRVCVNVCVCVCGGGCAGWRLEWGGEGGIHSLSKQFVIITDSRRHVKFITLAAETFFRSHQTD